MNRFDDAFMWRLAKMLLAPLISAFMVFVAFRVQLEHRMTVVETKTDNLVADVAEIHADVKELLRRVR